MTAGSAEQVKPGDLASGARRTENWYKETHVTTIKRGGGARKNTRARESEEHMRAHRVGYFFGGVPSNSVNYSVSDVQNMKIKQAS